MATKNDFENGTKKVKSGNLPLEQVKNEKSGRVLTAEEITAVKWYVELVLAYSPRSEEYKNATNSLARGGDLDFILRDFTNHASDENWIAEQRRDLAKLDKQMDDNIKARNQRMIDGNLLHRINGGRE